MSKNKKKFWSACLIAIITIALSVGLFVSGNLTSLENISYDWRMKHSRANSQATDEIAVILIDDASLSAMDPIVGRWPWPRSVHADIIDFISLGEPRAIVFDILFSEYESASNGRQAVSDSDLRLAESTAMGSQVIHAVQLHNDIEDEKNTSQLNQAMPAQALRHSLDNHTQLVSPDNNRYYLPFAELLQASHQLGVVSANADDDGVYRHARLFRNYQDQLYPTLGVAPLLGNDTAISGSDQSIQIGDRSLPVNQHADMLLNYYPHINSYSASGIIASAQQLLEGEIDNLIVDPYEFSDKIVFIGASAVGLEDLKTTPLSSTTPGVILHATATANILSGDILQPASLTITIMLSLGFSLLVSFFVIYQKRTLLKIISPVLLASAYLALAIYAFSNNQLMHISAPLGAIILATALGFTYLMVTEGRDKRRVRTMLGQYVSPAVLNSVVDQYEDQLKAEVGSNECLSILFSDIRGFTSLSEAVPADKVVEMLNYYFSVMTDTIFNHQGTIDKFIGDAIMAFWGAPIKEARHADKALQAAIEMDMRMTEVNNWLDTKGYPNLQVGIGINSGDVILGNIGSEQKLDYTVIGDNVNLASRLEGLTKQYGVAVVISESTYDLLQAPPPCCALDLVQVKGKQVPIRIFAPIIGYSDNEAKAIAEQAQQAFDAYLDQDWDQAIERYSKLPTETLKQIFIERCQAYRQSPPPADWDGAFTMTTK